MAQTPEHHPMKQHLNPGITPCWGSGFSLRKSSGTATTGRLLAHTTVRHPPVSGCTRRLLLRSTEPSSNFGELHEPSFFSLLLFVQHLNGNTLMRKYNVFYKIECILENFRKNLKNHAKETPGMAYAILQGVIWFSIFFLVTCIR